VGKIRDDIKILAVVGARPQFIKLAPLARALAGWNLFILHTGQHFDEKMSKIFFDEMQIPNPNLNLEISESTHAKQTGRMLMAIEDIYKQQRPDIVLVFGDTNSTLAGALAASKLGIPIMHIEAGLRSHDKAMPEEQNRILTDHLSDYLVCPSKLAVDNLRSENITKNVFQTGDIMKDAVDMFLQLADRKLVRKSLERKVGEILNRYCVLTLHRASNTDHKDVLTDLIKLCETVGRPIIFPVHPRTAKKMKEFEIVPRHPIYCIEPLSYIEMLVLIESAEMVITDSGGLQKEAFFVKTPCVTLRDTTEWAETVSLGANTVIMSDVACVDQSRFKKAFAKQYDAAFVEAPYGDGRAAGTIEKIIRKITS